MPQHRSLSLDVEAVRRIGAVPSILDMVCKQTGMRFAAVARVTRERWVTCAVRDGLSFGLAPGSELPIESTLCSEVQQMAQPIVINQVSQDPQYRRHHTPAMYGFESYISVPIVRADGEFFGTLCALDPLPNKLKSTGVLATFQNFAELIAHQLDLEDRFELTERALLNEQQAAELREQYIAVLGHDLRNPLFSVTAGIEAMLMLGLPDAQRDIAERILKSGARISALVDNILDFTRGKLGSGLSINLAPVPRLAAVLEHVVAELRVAHPGHDIETRFDIATPVDCDAPRLARLLSNLLANALIHGDAATPVQVEAAIEAGRFVLSVINQGNPISQELAGRLSQPFTRGNSESQSGGLGLGLYISTKIAEAHGGELGLVSDESGTCFTLSMPATATRV